MTFNDPGIIKEMLRNNGTYPGDPQMALIYSYEGVSKEPLFAVFAHESHDDMCISPYVRKYELLWSRTSGITVAGGRFLNET